MIKIGQVELQGDLATVILSTLIEDVPVNQKHVHDLAQSIKSVGQVSPLVIWSREPKIIDGFHRITAMKLLGLETATALIYDCDEETFWNLRILNAVTHRSVHFARIVEWVREVFAKTEWAKKLRVGEVFRIGRRGVAPKAILSNQERILLSEWVRDKSQLWNLSIQKIGSMLQIADLADPELVREVRDDSKPGNLTQAMLKSIASATPNYDIQRRLFHKVVTEKLTARDTERLVRELDEARTSSEKERLISEPFEKIKKGRPSNNTVTDLQDLRRRIATDSLLEIKFVLPFLTRPQTFDSTASEVLGLLALYLGGGLNEPMAILQKENQRLNEKVVELAEALRQKEEHNELLRRTRDRLQQQNDSLSRQIGR